MGGSPITSVATVNPVKMAITADDKISVNLLNPDKIAISLTNPDKIQVDLLER
jgi:hypothetical protein